MKAFRFPLETVLSYRRQIESDRKRAFALSLKALHEHEAALQVLFVTEAQGKEDLRAMESRALDLAEVLAQRRWLGVLARRIVAARERLQIRQAAHQQARQAFLEAGRARRVLERLRERRHDDYLTAVAREEQKEMNEIAARVFAVAREESA